MKTLNNPELWQTGSYIDGQWLPSSNQYKVTNPANGQVIAQMANAGRAETEQAIAAAEREFHHWKKLTAKERAQIIRRWGQLMIENIDDLATILTLEQGKPLAEAKGEIQYSASFFEWFSEEAKRSYGDIIPTHKADARVVVIKQPIGVVGAITPWNFPSAMIGRKVGPALAAGCTIVVKPSEETPLSANALAVLAAQAGVPAGVFNIVSGDAPAIGSSLMAADCVRKISFTGSTNVGKLLMRQASDQVKKVSLELGGNAPFIVFEDADLDKAVTGALASKFRNSGQTCVCVNRFLIQNSVYDAFVTKLVAAVQQLKLGDGFTKGTTLGPLINQDSVNKVKHHLSDALAKGATIACGGKLSDPDGLFFEPTVLTNVDESMIFSSDETFGPIAPCYRFNTEEEAIAMANNTNTGLASYFYSQNISRAWRVGEAIEAGIVGINEGIISTEIAPFGGIKESGLGREGSKYGLDDYMETKYMLMGL